MDRPLRLLSALLILTVLLGLGSVQIGADSTLTSPEALTPPIEPIIPITPTDPTDPEEGDADLMIWPGGTEDIAEMEPENVSNYVQTWRTSTTCGASTA